MATSASSPARVPPAMAYQYYQLTRVTTTTVIQLVVHSSCPHSFSVLRGRFHPFVAVLCCSPLSSPPVCPSSVLLHMGNSPSTSTGSTGLHASRPPYRSLASPLSPFTIAEVTLTAGSAAHSQAVGNAQYLLSLSVDRLLYSFRQYAGLDLHGAKPYGGWESPDNGGRGTFTGHALGAYAAASVSLKATRPDLATACGEAATALVTGLAEVQKAIGPLISPQPFGYLNAQSPAVFDSLEKLQQCPVPYYVVHKIMAGLVSAYRWTGNAQALTVVSAMADYHAWRMAQLTEERIQAMIDTRRYPGQAPRFFCEHGGILDVCIDVYRLTKKDSHLTLARHFDRPWFRDMLASGDDQLGQNGEHSNTELPVVVGLANLYSNLGQSDIYRQAVVNFLDWMQTGHEFCTGRSQRQVGLPLPAGLQQRAVQHSPAAGPADQQHSGPWRPGQWRELLCTQPAEVHRLRPAVERRRPVGRRVGEALRQLRPPSAERGHVHVRVQPQPQAGSAEAVRRRRELLLVLLRHGSGGLRWTRQRPRAP